MKNSERYNTIRRVLNYNNFIKWLKQNPDIEFKNNSSRQCPVALYLKDTLPESFDKSFVIVAPFTFCYIYNSKFYRKSMSQLFTNFVINLDDLGHSISGKTGDVIELAEEMKRLKK